MPGWIAALLLGMGLALGLSAIGVPIAFGLLVAAFVCLTVFMDPMIAMNGLTVSLYGSVTDPALLPIPLFILMASFLMAGGVSVQIYDSFAKIFHGFKAGLLVATNGMMAFLGSLMGSSSAAITMVTQMGARELQARGFNNYAIGGVIAGGSGLAVVLPPSILMIVYSVTLEVPIIPLFAAGIGPGILIALLNTVWIIIYTYFNPPSSRVVSTVSKPRRVAPGDSEHAISVIDAQHKLGAWERLVAAARLVPIALVVFAMLGSMLTGIASITEGAAVGALGALLVGLHRMTLKKLAWSFWNTAQITCFILILILGGRYFGLYFSLTGVSSQFIYFIQSIPLSGKETFYVIMIVFLLIGCIMETMTMMLVLVPIAATALVMMGFDPILLGILFVINLEMSLLTPPIGSNLFILAGIGQRYGIRFGHIVWGVMPYQIISFLVIVITMEFPAVSLYLADMVR